MELKRGFKQTEIGALPSDWDVSTVGAEFSVKLGKMLDAANNFGVAKPYVGNRAVQWDCIDVTDLPTVPMSPSDLRRFRLEKGDLLVCEGGEVGRAAIWDAPIEECYYQKAIHRLRPLGDYNAKLMVAVLRRWASTGLFANYVTQTSIAHLPRDKFIHVPIPRPPEAEQRSIAQVLSDVDALLDGMNRLIAKKRDLKQAAMQQLLTGRTRLPGFAAPWQPQALSHAGKCLRGVTYDSATDLVVHDTEITHRLLRANNVQGSTVNIDDVQYVRSQRVKPEQVLRQLDVLICMANGSKALVGKAGLFQIADGFRYTFGAFMGCFRVDASVADPRFIFYLFQTDQYRNYINLLLAGSSINNLRPSSIESLEFQIPKPTEQTAIADVISDMDAEITALEARRDKARLIKQGMMQELLTGRTRLIDTKGAIA